MNLNTLNGIPDPADQGFDALLDWIKAQIAVIRKTSLTPEILKTFRPAELGDCPAHPLGPEADPAWRRFFLATLLADWA
ncbi:MAG: hypothetical protein PHE27_02110, partial [Alphaproteobacteria bacterium]|nr:hypothetical protein [Alphaproteobacteria bacterium]